MTTTHSVRVIVVAADEARGWHIRLALAADPDIVVVDLVRPGDATRCIADMLPHVVISYLPIADRAGQAAIEEIMAVCPRPIVVLVEGDDDQASRATRDALDAGAVDAMRAPTDWTAEAAGTLRHTVHQLSKVHVVRRRRRTPNGTAGHNAHARTGQAIVAVAASTGGPSALAVLLAGLGGVHAPVLVVQHLHPEFTGGLLEWMSRVSALPVKTAADGELLRAGQVYLAPGDVHLRVDAHGRAELTPTPARIHRPSADELFTSVAERSGRSGVGVMLTGMGDDGARGMLAMRDAGARTFAQDEASCAVFGMPQAALRIDAVTDVLPLEQLAAAIARAVGGVFA